MIDRMLFCLSAAVVLLVLLMSLPSYGGVLECNSSPGQDGRRWLWRDIDGRQCWFMAQKGQRRGQDQPKEELYWKSPDPPDDPKQGGPPPWEMEQRWMPSGGWDHKE
jgi:hypothetical protein